MPAQLLITWWVQLTISSALIRPALRPNSTPSWNRIKAGMPDTPKADAAWGSASELSLSRRTFGSRRPAAAAYCGAMARQGPHQGAQTSTRTAPPFVSRRCLDSPVPVTSSGAPEKSASRHLPHLATEGSRCSGKRLVAPQAGQTYWRVTADIPWLRAVHLESE